MPCQQERHTHALASCTKQVQRASVPDAATILAAKHTARGGGEIRDKEKLEKVRV